jgi:hypothetical protein
MNIDSVASHTNDPRKFWDHIKRLGPQKNSKIPNECYSNTGELTSDPNVVREKWSSEFKNLLNQQHDESFDSDFKLDIVNQKHHMERNMLDPLYDANSELNAQIDIAEIDKVVQKAKNGKSPGVDELPYNVLKSKNVIKALHKMFLLYFDTHIIPSIWRKAIICPILKDNTLDPRIPLNYRGISLQCVVAKIYSSVLNNRLLAYLENNELLVDEQNGFRKDRSCLDHVFTLNSVTQNENSTFVVFIDLQKAFDSVDRDLLEFRLFDSGIDGNFYHAVRSLYKNTQECVRLDEEYTDWFNYTSG